MAIENGHVRVECDLARWDCPYRVAGFAGVRDIQSPNSIGRQDGATKDAAGRTYRIEETRRMLSVRARDCSYITGWTSGWSSCKALPL